MPEVRVTTDLPDLPRAVRSACRLERQAVREHGPEDIAEIGLVGEGLAQVRDARPDVCFHLVHEDRELGRRSLGGDHLCFEVLDPRRPLLQLRDQLGDVVRECDRFRQALLFGANGGQLGFQRSDVGVAFRELRFDLGPQLLDHHRERLFAEHVRLQLVDQRRLDLLPALVDGHRAHRAAAIAMSCAAVRRHALGASSKRAHAMRDDRTAARTAVRDARERILRPGLLGHLRYRAAGREPRLHREPRGVIHNAPLSDLGLDHVARIRLHASSSPALANLLDPSVEVDPTITRVEQDRAYRARRPRAATATSGGRSRDTFVIEAMGDLLESAIGEILGVDPADDRRLVVVDDRQGVLASRAVALALQPVAVAAPSGDSAVTHARPQRFARARPDRLELHLVAGALDEGRRLVDGVRELHFLAGRVVVEAASAVAHQVANHQRHLDRVATEPGLIAADDDVATLRVREQLTQSGAREEVIAGAAIVDVVGARLRCEPHPRDHLRATGALNVEAELLFAFVVLGSPAIGSDLHAFLPSSIIPLVLGSCNRRRAV